MSSLLHSSHAPFPSLGEFMLRLLWHMTLRLCLWCFACLCRSPAGRSSAALLTYVPCCLQ